MVVKFRYTTVGLTVTFINLSEEIPEGYIYLWNFGDNNQSNEMNPIHTYQYCGSYQVNLYIKGQNNQTVGNSKQTIIVTDKVKTHLSGSIYDLIDIYLPTDLVGDIPQSTKQMFIEKWQLYIQPLVNHCIPVEYYNNELYYEALENQLIMELAAYDFTINEIMNLSKALAHSVIDNNSTSQSDNNDVSDGNNGIKKISTGPTEVEYFDSTASDSDISGAITKAMQPGGIIDIMKQNLCMLASRLEIYLPICDRPTSVVIPRVVNRRKPGPISGPDPLNLLNKL